MGKRVGIMGGTFDPVHNGHLIIAEMALENFELDEILFVPSGIPWLKDVSKVLNKKTRVSLTGIAIEDNPNFAYENGLIKEAASKVVGDTVNNNEKSIVIQFGDIYVSGVDDANSFAREIVNRLPNAVARELGK